MGKLRTALALAILLGAVAGEARASAAPVRVVVNSGLEPVTLAPKRLRALFTRKAAFWPDGSAVVVFVLPTRHPLHQRFCREQLGLLPFQLDRAWNHLVFSGAGERPQVVASEEEMRARLRQTPGAIGYLSAERAEGPGITALSP
ncbi:hypothetical protein [Ferrimonas balearica]|uniref:hypothetical protein n=1 Tax=Ferrimonas balearica TaxID=44012 RepID=UPI001C99C225|nr:hypothetical protein [Ferrimonas balearica]MBY5993618.1 hypothetical protein [Ferrimonas balearica]